MICNYSLINIFNSGPFTLWTFCSSSTINVSFIDNAISIASYAIPFHAVFFTSFSLKKFSSHLLYKKYAVIYLP